MKSEAVLTFMAVLIVFSALAVLLAMVLAPAVEHLLELVP